jgi:hypothetical protein
MEMKAEIVEKIKALAEQEKVMGSLTTYNDLVTEFYKIQEEEELKWEQAKQARIESGEKPETIEKPVYPLLNEFKLYTNIFKEKKIVEIQAKKEAEKVNLSKKRALIAALADLVQNEENIGRAIGRFRDIQESWKEVGPIPRDKRQEVQKEFSTLIDTFQYNINIYKEIKDHDLSRNLTLKQAVIENIKSLLELDKIKTIEKKLHAFQEEWNAIGGTSQEDWEKIKDDYYGTVNKVYEKIHAFYEARRTEQAENILKKKELIEKAKEIEARELTGHKDFGSATEELLALQNEWKTIGYGPKQENEEVWQTFRSICNHFFDKKKAFYSERDGEFAEIKAKKEALIAEIEAIKESTDWKTVTQKIVAVQNQWKKLGSAGPKFENQLWKKFRAPIDYFFNAKDAHFAEKDEANQANLDLKLALIEKIKAYDTSGEPKDAVNDLRAMSSEFAEIGNVPFAEKDNVYKAYKDALDAKYDSIKMDKSDKEKMLFQAKVDSIMGSPNSDKLAEQEKASIRAKIDSLNKEIIQYENNLAFFSNADDSNPLFRNVMASIEKNKSEIESHKIRLKLIREASK